MDVQKILRIFVLAIGQILLKNTTIVVKQLALGVKNIMSM